MSIFLWVGNWFCWYRECCCFNAFDQYSNKVFVWWLSFICFTGIIACCIAGFVTANRFGFCSYAIQCAYERVYYDTINGQIKTTYPKWEGISQIKELLDKIDDIYNAVYIISSSDLTFNGIEIEGCVLPFPVPKSYIEQLCGMEQAERDKFYKSLGIGISSLYNLYNYQQIDKTLDKEYQTELSNIEDGLKEYNKQFVSDFEYWVHVARGLGKIVPLIYFAILLTVVVLACSLLIIYYCNCIECINQDQYIFPMHIIWNIIRFFIFSFFMYGFGFGVLFLLARDYIGYLQFILEKQTGENPRVISPKANNYFQYCLNGKNMFEKLLGNAYPDEFIKNTINFENWKNNNPTYSGGYEEIFNNYKKLLIDAYNVQNQKSLTQYQNLYNNAGSIYSILDCSFIRSEFNLLYNALWDFAWETRVLCALSCFIAFFGVLGVYGFLWSMYIWRRKDNGGFRYTRNNNEGDDDSNRPKENSRLKKRLIRPPQIRNDNENNNNNSQEMQNQNNENGDEDEIS